MANDPKFARNQLLQSDTNTTRPNTDCSSKYEIFQRMSLSEMISILFGLFDVLNWYRLFITALGFSKVVLSGLIDVICRLYNGSVDCERLPQCVSNCPICRIHQAGRTVSVKSFSSCLTRSTTNAAVTGESVFYLLNLAPNPGQNGSTSGDKKDGSGDGIPNMRHNPPDFGLESSSRASKTPREGKSKNAISPKMKKTRSLSRTPSTKKAAKSATSAATKSTGKSSKSSPAVRMRSLESAATRRTKR